MPSQFKPKAVQEPKSSQLQPKACQKHKVESYRFGSKWTFKYRGFATNGLTAFILAVQTMSHITRVAELWPELEPWSWSFANFSWSRSQSGINISEMTTKNTMQGGWDGHTNCNKRMVKPNFKFDLTHIMKNVVISSKIYLCTPGLRPSLLKSYFRRKYLGVRSIEISAVLLLVVWCSLHY